MKILEYDEVDPLEVLQLNFLALEFALTPERVKLIRQYDPRPFPIFALYAIVDEVVAGQVGIFRLPMVSIDGPEDVGGVWAVCTHPSFLRRNIANHLLNEAHERMREEGLRLSTLGTSKHRVAHILYQKQGYRDIFFSASILFRHEVIKDYNSDLHIEQARHDRLHLADDLFREVSTYCLGFARRHEPFIPAMVEIGEIAMGRIEEKNVWLVWKKNKLVGYFVAEYSGSILNVKDILLKKSVNPLNAIAALARKLPAPYIQIKSNNNSITKSLSDLLKDRILVVPQDWSTFMVKPLTKDVMKLDLKSLFGIGTDRFLFSWLDST